MANFKQGDHVYYVDFAGDKTYRIVDRVAHDGAVWFTNGAWMPTRELHLVGEAVNKPADNVNNPAHYTQGGIETLDFIKAKLSKEAYKGFLQANIIKYVTRFEHKNGAEDLKKAEFYLRELIALEEPINPILRKGL